MRLCKSYLKEERRIARAMNWGMPRLMVAALLLGAAFAQSPSTPNPNVTITGKLQGPNGTPVANSIISLSPTQTFFVAGLGSASCNSYQIDINETGLTCTDTIDFNDETPAAPLNALNVVWSTSNSNGIDSVSAAIQGDGNPAHCLNGQGAWVNCSGGGSGNVTNAVQFSMPYYSASGSGNQIAGVPPPTGVDNVSQTFSITPSGGAVLGAWNPSGVPPRASTCTSNVDTILAVDRLHYVSWSDASACAVTLPQASTTGFASNFAFVGCDIGAGTATITPTTSTLSYTTGSGYTTGALALSKGQCAFFYSDNTNYFAITLNGSFSLPVQEIGDVPRYNVNADGSWDSVNYAQQQSSVSPVWGGSPIAVGPLASGLAFLGGTGDVNPTATAGAARSYTSSASGSTSTVVGLTTGQNGSNSFTGMLAFYRWTLKLKIGQTTNARFWCGLGSFNSTGAGNNTQAILGTTAYAADSPNKTTLGFRYSSTTDTHWQAVAAVAGGSQTTTDTGITPDTNPHIFEMATNAAGTSIFYFIDGVQVATISTNLPSPASGADSWGNMFITGDNKNTANAVAITFYGMQISLK